MGKPWENSKFHGTYGLVWPLATYSPRKTVITGSKKNHLGVNNVSYRSYTLIRNC